MKKLLLALLLLSPFSAQAAIIGAPFLPEIDNRFNNIEQSLYSNTEAGNSGLFVSHHAKGIYNISTSGTYSPSNSVVIPPNAIIQQVFWYTSASGSPAAGATMSGQCNVANDLISGVSLTNMANNTITAGVPTGTAATMVYSSAGCTPKMVLGVSNVTAGVYNLFIDYVVAK